MQTVVQKWGNSLGIRIPSLYVKELKLKNGSAVEVREEEGRLVILPQKETLEDLLASIDASALHESIDTGSSLGREAW